jgi:hypothetical protein
VNLGVYGSLPVVSARGRKNYSQARSRSSPYWYLCTQCVCISTGSYIHTVWETTSKLKSHLEGEGDVASCRVVHGRPGIGSKSGFLGNIDMRDFEAKS